VLVQEALDPLEAAGTELLAVDGQELADGVTWLPAAAAGDVLRIDAEFRPGAAGKVGLVLRADREVAGGSAGGSASGSERTVLAYDSASGELSLDRTASGNVSFHEAFPSVERVAVPLVDGRLRLRVFLDRCSVEVFAQDGLATITDQLFPGESSTAVGLLAEGDAGTLVSLTVTG
jgi:levanase/fructan beta-fructosidase